MGVPAQRIHQMHRDHVPTLPPRFLLLGSTTVSQIQGMILPYEHQPSQTHIFCLQGLCCFREYQPWLIRTFVGHPEFVPDIVNKIIDVRGKSGAMDATTVTEGRKRAVRPDDGTGTIGRAIWKVLGVNSRTA